MEHFFTLTLCCIVLLLFNGGECLRCRSGNQRVDPQLQRALKTCKQRYSGNDDFMSSNNDNSENDSNSEENVYTKSFFYQNRGRSSYSQSMNNQRNSDKNDAKTYSSDRSTNENFRDFDDTKRTHRTNERNSWFSRDSHNERSNFDNGDSRSNNTTNREQNCIIQCFFDELNIVDHRGFPERDLVISVMSQNIQDSELKDFVEESIIECYRYLVSNKRNKCEFSQNLLTCLAEKGQKECDDWED